ncbi:hypothetical protein ACP70R_032325 [Stipagrostis hirtigluma subsp. patula]
MDRKSTQDDTARMIQLDSKLKWMDRAWKPGTSIRIENCTFGSG